MRLRGARQTPSVYCAIPGRPTGSVRIFMMLASSRTTDAMPDQYWICKECNESYRRKQIECRRCGHTAFQKSDTEPGGAEKPSTRSGGDGSFGVREFVGGQLEPLRAGYVEPLFSRRLRPYLMGVLLTLFILILVVLLLWP